MTLLTVLNPVSRELAGSMEQVACLELKTYDSADMMTLHQHLNQVD